MLRWSKTHSGEGRLQEHKCGKRKYMGSASSTTLQSIHLAAAYNDLGKVRQCLCLGSNVDARAEDGSTPLIVCSENGHLALVQYLLTQRADVNLVDREGASALTVAASNGHLGICELLIQKGALDLIDKPLLNDRSTALIAAARRGHLQVVKRLLKARANATLVDREGLSALNYAIRGGHEEVVSALLEAGVSVNVASNDGSTPLLDAVDYNRVCVVRNLLRRGADPSKGNSRGTTPLHLSCFHGFHVITEALLQSGAHIEVVNKSKHTPLTKCCSEGHVKCLLALIKAGADVSFTGNGCPPIIIAAEAGFIDIVRILLDSGSDIDQVDTSDGSTALLRTHELPMIELLVDSGASTAKKDVNGLNAIHRAVLAGCGDPIIRRLAKAGVDPLCSSKQGTPLLMAKTKGNREAVGILTLLGLTPRVIINAPQIGGNTAEFFPRQSRLLYVTDVTESEGS